MIYALRAHGTLATRWVLFTSNRPVKGPLSDIMINKCASQAVCGQESNGLMLHRAW